MTDPTDPLAHLYVDALAEEADVDLDLPTRPTTLEALEQAEPEPEPEPAERDVIALVGILEDRIAELGRPGLDDLDAVLVDLGLAEGFDDDGDPMLNATGRAVVKTIMDRIVALGRAFGEMMEANPAIAAELRRRGEEAGPAPG